jgi:hypothetical protein
VGGQDDHAHVGVGSGGADGFSETSEDSGGQGIARGVVEGDSADA